MRQQPVIKLYKPLKDKPSTGLTIRQILQASLDVNAATPAATIKILSGTPVSRVYSSENSCKVGYRFRVKDVRSSRQPPQTHMAYVWAHDEDYSGPLSARNVKVKVSCSCEAFLFKSEYALNYYQASVIHFSNGQPPNFTNPGLIPFACKHLEKILMQMLRNGM
jgi:hypothetical protein